MRGLPRSLARYAVDALRGDDGITDRLPGAVACDGRERLPGSVTEWVLKLHAVSDAGPRIELKPELAADDCDIGERPWLRQACVTRAHGKFEHTQETAAAGCTAF